MIILNLKVIMISRSLLNFVPLNKNLKYEWLRCVFLTIDSLCTTIIYWSLALTTLSLMLVEWKKKWKKELKMRFSRLKKVSEKFGIDEIDVNE